MTNTILVVAAHPDDEVLGCGGTLAKHADMGDAVHILILAEGATSRQNQRDRNNSKIELAQLANSAERSANILGAKSIKLLDFPDNRLDSIPRLDVIKSIEFYIDLHKPNVVYTHHSGDLNIDHQIVHESVMTACRPTPGNCVKTLLSFEVASSTEWQSPFSASPFQPNWYVDISEQLGRKKQALAAYESEMKPWPHSRSIESVAHLAHLRGSHVSANASEAFFLLRHLS